MKGCMKMNLENIKKDMRIKNYKEMCSLLGENIKNGNSKKAQLKEWERYFTYSKDGNKFIINEIYSIPKEKEDGRSESGSIYSEDIQKLLLDLLAQKENNGNIFLSCNQLLLKLQMVNSNYSMGRNNIPRLSEIMKVDELVIKDVYDYTHNKLKSILENALNSLSRKSWINYYKKITVCVNKVSVETNALGQPKLNSNNSIEYIVTPEYREATIEEEQYILGVEANLLDEMKCEDKRDLIIKGRMEEFRCKVNKLLKENCNIEFYYNSYQIISNKEVLVERLGRFEKANRFNNLNNNILKSSKKSIVKKHENAKSKYEWGLPTEDKIEYIRCDREYVDNSNLIVTKIIDRKTRKIKGFYDAK